MSAPSSPEEDAERYRVRPHERALTPQERLPVNERAKTLLHLADATAKEFARAVTYAVLRGPAGESFQCRAVLRVPGEEGACRLAMESIGCSYIGRQEVPAQGPEKGAGALPPTCALSFAVPNRLLPESMRPDLGRNAAREFRASPSPTPAADRTREVALLADRFLSSVLSVPRVTEEEISATWKETVGEFVAKNTTPGKMRGTMLVVNYLQPAIHFDLQRQSATILGKLQERYGKRFITQVSFRLGGKG